ncbi:hypothetical protein LJB76_02120 [Clostridia bacterium OttesenSCG-928-O13]|nr:hypothetical protein [Clostridia bacterium OttesenSCG-928-O13]
MRAMQMPWWWAIVTFLLGSGGVFTVIWFVFTRRINKADQKKAAAKAAEEEAEAARAEANRLEWLRVKAYRQKLGRFLFWLVTEILALIEKVGHNPVNGHLRDSWEAFQQAEADLKSFEDEQASNLHKD